MLSLRDEYTQNFSLSRTFFHVLGVYPLPDVSTKWRFLTDIWFWIAYVNLAVCALVELITIVIGFATDSSNFVDNVAIVPLLSYTVISLEQILSVYRKRDRYIVFLVALRDLFEKHSKEDLRRNNYENYQRRGRNERVSYAISYIALIMTFNFISVGRSIVTYFQDGHWFLELPYAVWYPFNTREDGVFMLVYLQQLWWGFTCIMGVLAINLLLATVTDHICFEFYVLGGKFKALNLKDVQCRSLIRDLVGHHNILIGLTQELASLISFSLLMNFMLITVVMCTVGFQIIATDSLSESLKFLLFLLVCLLQTLSLSYFGNRIMDAVGIREWPKKRLK